MKLATLKPRVANVDLSIAQPNSTSTTRLRGRKLQQRNARLSMRQPLCAECLKRGRITLGEEWDHIVPLWDGGADHESNLQHLCKAHHEAKSAAENARRVRFDAANAGGEGSIPKRDFSEPPGGPMDRIFPVKRRAITRKPLTKSQLTETGKPEDSVQQKFTNPLDAIRYVREQTDTLMLAFSGGKDSVCTWLKLREHFNRIVPVHRYWIPGLKFEERALAYYEEVFETPIVRIPHPALYDVLRFGMFQTPVTYQVTSAWGFGKVTADEQKDWIAEDLKLPTKIIAVGLRASDSVNRLFTIKRVGCFNHAAQVLYPIADLRKEDLAKMLRVHRIKISPEYRYIGRSWDGLQLTYIQMLKAHFPEDYETVRQWCPLIELEFARAQVYASQQTASN